MRQLKFHEKKLLRKVDNQWATDDSQRENQVLRRYRIQKREDYLLYNRLCGQIGKVAHMLARLPANDEFRRSMTDALLEKLYQLGVIQSKTSLQLVHHLSTSAFCRRRLPVVLVRLKYCETLKEAVTFIEQGHIRVGPEVVTDPAYLVPRTMQDFVTWVDSSKIKRKVLKYNDKLDDYDLL